MRLIDAEAFNSWLEGYAREYVLGKRKISITNILEHVRDMPTIQTGHKRGRWIYHPDWDTDGECPYECDQCGMGSDVNYCYCMRCGAKMSEGEDV